MAAWTASIPLEHLWDTSNKRPLSMFHAKFFNSLLSYFYFYLSQQCAHALRMCYRASVTFHNMHVVPPFLACLERNWVLKKKKKEITKRFHLFPPPTVDRPPNNASAESLCTRGCVAPRIETVSSSISSLDRHGESPACSHLWAGRSHRAPEGERQSQVLSRVWGMSADYLSPKKNKKCLV